MEEELSVSSHDGAWLAGTLSVPEQARALFVPIHGSQVQTRDGSLDASRHWIFPFGGPQRNLFLDLRARLLPLNAAVYRYDKRASGASEGIYAKTTLDDLAKDLIAVCAKLKERFPSLPLLVLGQSEGTLTIPRACELGLLPDGIILQGAVSWPARRIFEFQRTHAGRPFLEDKTGEMSRKFPFYAGYYRAMVSTEFWERLADPAQSEFVVALPGGYRAVQSLEMVRQWDACDSRRFLKTVSCPVHYIMGTRDENTPAEAIEELAAWVAQERLPHARFHFLDGLDHNFRRLEPGDNFIESAKKPIDSGYLELFSGIVSSLLDKIPAPARA